MRESAFFWDDKLNTIAMKYFMGRIYRSPSEPKFLSVGQPAGYICVVVDLLNFFTCLSSRLGYWKNYCPSVDRCPTCGFLECSKKLQEIMRSVRIGMPFRWTSLNQCTETMSSLKVGQDENNLAGSVGSWNNDYTPRHHSPILQHIIQCLHRIIV